MARSFGYTTEDVLRAKEGDLLAQERVVFGNTGLLRWAAAKFAPGVDRDEAFQEGVVVLLEAIQKWKVDGGRTFPNYVTLGIRQHFHQKRRAKSAHEVPCEIRHTDVPYKPEPADAYCLACGALRREKDGIICATCCVRRHRMKLRFGGEGLCARCGIILKDMNGFAWCGTCGYNAELREKNCE